MILKEFRQMRRDRRTMALLFMVPLLMLTVFGYAARFDVKQIPTAVVGRPPPPVLEALGSGFKVVERHAAGDDAFARRLLRDSKAHVTRAVTATTTTVEALGLTRTFGAFTAVDAVDLRVGPGEVVGLLAPRVPARRR